MTIDIEELSHAHGAYLALAESMASNNIDVHVMIVFAALIISADVGATGRSLDEALGELQGCTRPRCRAAAPSHANARDRAGSRHRARPAVWERPVLRATRRGRQTTRMMTAEMLALHRKLTEKEGN